jgi:2-polyprenyl-3-methyl-5-hydroxy-6-metoxy-1,4-benzoquinol methylase
MQHYDEKYFSWQDRLGHFGGKANLHKFLRYIQPDDQVLDFGCGGGHLLNNIPCKDKIGLEVNDAAREKAKAYGFPVYSDLDEIPDNSASVVICNSVLEHIECPLYELRRLIPKIEPGGKAIFVILNQMPQEAYVPNDINRHLYTWNPMTLGTMLEEAGFVDIQVDVIRHAWPQTYMRWSRLGERVFHLRCKIEAYLKNNYQVRAVAYRPKA